VRRATSIRGYCATAEPPAGRRLRPGGRPPKASRGTRSPPRRRCPPRRSGRSSMTATPARSSPPTTGRSTETPPRIEAPPPAAQPCRRTCLPCALPAALLVLARPCPGPWRRVGVESGHRAAAHYCVLLRRAANRPRTGRCRPIHLSSTALVAERVWRRTDDPGSVLPHSRGRGRRTLPRFSSSVPMNTSTASSTSRTLTLSVLKPSTRPISSGTSSRINAVPPSPSTNRPTT
jgi:hypothetical protein